MENINRWRSNQFQPPFYFESGQFDTRGLWVHNMNVVISINRKSQPDSYVSFCDQTDIQHQLTIQVLIHIGGSKGKH